jgi:hypothetical protein
MSGTLSAPEISNTHAKFAIQMLLMQRKPVKSDQFSSLAPAASYPVRSMWSGCDEPLTLNKAAV